MRKMSFTSWMLVACAVVLLDTLQTTTGQDENPLKKLSTAITSFSTDLMVKLINSNPDVSNVIFSPTSIYVALAMLYAGSGGVTKSQLASSLHLEVFKSDETEFYESIKILLQTMNSTQKGHTLKMVNRLFAEKGSQFNDDYLEKLSDYFSSKPEELDFSGDPSGSTSKINKWVARMTSDKIKELFPNGIITSDTHLALASAVSFKAPWLYKFDKKNTKPQAFYTHTNKKVQIPMMNLPFVAGLSYLNSKESGFQVLELPYVGGKFTALIFLMNKNVSSNSLQKRRGIDQAEKAYRPKNVSVKLSLPKFALSPTINLKKSLLALGMEDLFNGDIADISNIVTAHSVPLSAAMHRTYFAFKEDGTQEAGATEGHNRRPFPFPSKPIDFVVDRTFLFKVLEKATDCELLYGFIANPVKSD